MSDKSGVSEQVLALPEGGGAMRGLGETFAPDLHTGTGNLTVPLTLPQGRAGFAPRLELAYSSGHPNGAFGYGWRLDTREITRMTSKGVPQYRNAPLTPEDEDTFILEGAEELVAIDAEQPRHYRPRTDELFARIAHFVDQAAENDRWEVRHRDGSVDVFGGEDADGTLASVQGPGPTAGAPRLFCWKRVCTTDSFGNRIEYLYSRYASRVDGPHCTRRWIARASARELCRAVWDAGSAVTARSASVTSCPTSFTS